MIQTGQVALTSDPSVPHEWDSGDLRHLAMLPSSPPSRLVRKRHPSGRRPQTEGGTAVERVVVRCCGLDVSHGHGGGSCTCTRADRPAARARAVAGQSAAGRLASYVPTIPRTGFSPEIDTALSRHTFEPFGQRRILATLFNRFGEASVEKSDETEARGKEFRPKRTSLQSLVQSITPEFIAPGTHDRTTLTRKQGSRRS